MNILKYFVFCCLLAISFNANSVEWSHGKIRAVGKSMLSMTGFYLSCSKKSLVELDAAAYRWGLFMGGKYLVIAGIENDSMLWTENGEKGILIEDPEKSENTMSSVFTKQSCTAIKDHIDAQYYLILNKIISGKL